MVSRSRFLPLCNEDGSVVVVCNGEIYNHRSQRQELEQAGHTFTTHTDAEVLVHLYEAYGTACVQYLRGMFAFALWDVPRQRLLLGRDPLGIKPLFYCQRDHCLAFASEMKALCLWDAVERRLNYQAVDALLTYFCIPGAATLLDGIQKLPPGHLLRPKRGLGAPFRAWYAHGLREMAPDYLAAHRIHDRDYFQSQAIPQLFHPRSGRFAARRYGTRLFVLCCSKSGVNSFWTTIRRVPASTTQYYPLTHLDCAGHISPRSRNVVTYSPRGAWSQERFCGGGAMGGELKGVVLIAGEQCFTKIAGVPLLQRVLLSGHKAGIQEWVVLSWHDAQRLRSALRNEAKLKDISWQVYDLQDIDAKHLATVLPANEVIVISCTAVFDYRLLLELQKMKGSILCVTAASAATTEGVTLQDGYVLPNMPTASPAYRSTGILRCSGVLLEYVMRQAWGDLQHTSAPLHALLPGLIERTPVKAFDVSQHLWAPIVAPFEASVAAAEKQLFRHLGRQGDSLIVRLLNRRMSQALTKRLIRTAATPNQITLFSATLGLSGAFFLAHPTDLLQILGSLLFLCSTIIDGCDGEVARLTFQESDFGGKLDIMMDNVVHLCLFPGIALGLYWETGTPLALLLGALTLGGVLMSLIAYLPSLWRPSAKRSVHVRVHESLASRDFAYLLLLLALFDRLDWFLWAAAVGTYVFAAAWMVISYIQRRRESRAITDA